MARSVTAQDVIDEVQVLVEDPSHAVATETQYLARLNRHWARLYAYYVGAEPDRFRTEETITSTGVAAYNLPATWLATVGIDAISGNQRTELRRLQEEERNDYIGRTGVPEAFRLVGSTQVTLYPTPTTGLTFTHIYIPTAPVLVVGTSIDCRLGHEAYLEWCLARELLKAKQEYDGRWDDDIAKIEMEMKTEANLRYFTDVVTMAAHRQRREWPYGQRPNGQWWPWGLP